MRWWANPTSQPIWIFLSDYYSIYLPPSGKLTPHKLSSLYSKLYMRHFRFLRGLPCVPVIGTHTHQRYRDYYLDTIWSSWTSDPRPASPSTFSWGFLKQSLVEGRITGPTCFPLGFWPRSIFGFPQQYLVLATYIKHVYYWINKYPPPLKLQQGTAKYDGWFPTYKYRSPSPW